MVVLIDLTVVDKDESAFDFSVVVKCALKVATLTIREDQEGLAVGLDQLKGDVVLHRDGR